MGGGEINLSHTSQDWPFSEKGIYVECTVLCKSSWFFSADSSSDAMDVEISL